jgi:poly(A) polymerase/tRNA nucleotidyltransferase (CCA-adding enzyme)
MFNLPFFVIEFAKYFINAGYECYLVGGAVRNMASGNRPTDYDFTTDAKPEQVIKLFKHVIPTGIKHGTVTVLFKGHSFEVTTFRIDDKYTDSRRPDSVTYTADILEDLKRRDFTINSMALDLKTRKLIDPHSGLKDLKNKIIKAIGDPMVRFDEDGLRLLRACRFAARLEFEIEENTWKAIAASVHKLESVSAERIRDELIKMLLADKPSIGFKIMDSTKILDLIIPELSACKGIKHRSGIQYDVFLHSLYACDGAPSELLHLRLAALFHDIGKAKVFTIENGEPAFHGHEEASAVITEEIMKRLRFSNEQIKTTVKLIQHHMFNYSEDWTDAAVRRFINRVGMENIHDLLVLRIADHYGYTRTHSIPQYISSFQSHIDKMLQEDRSFTVKDLVIDGNILNEKAGIPKGRAMGTILQALLEAVLDDPSLNSQEKLIEIAGKFYMERINSQER